MRSKRNIWIGGFLLFFIAFLTYTFFSQPGPGGLKGGFSEIAATRNENNTGPVIRLYAVEVQDPLVAEFIAYGDFMPHTKYGKTTVFFFLPGQSPPSLRVDEPSFDTLRYAPVATYTKNSMGDVRLKKNTRHFSH